MSPRLKDHGIVMLTFAQLGEGGEQWSVLVRGQLDILSRQGYEECLTAV